MAVEFDGGVVVGADSRTTTGQFVANRVTDKLTRLSDTIYCCRSGSAADTQLVADVVSTYLDMLETEQNEAPTVAIAANLAKSFVYGNKDYLLASLIIAGYDAQSKGSVYTVSLGGTILKQPYAIGGSGSSYIYGFCDSNFKPGMTAEQCRAFVATGTLYFGQGFLIFDLALAHAMARDGSSGGVVRLATIDSSGVNKTMIPGDQLPYLVDSRTND
jgi:20S proteasome subunit beta 1